jgi:hypothetical protein
MSSPRCVPAKLRPPEQIADALGLQVGSKRDFNEANRAPPD